MASLVDVNTINPFLTSSMSVINAVSGISTTVGKLSVRDTKFNNNSVLIMLGVTGQLEGQVVFDINEDNAKLLASKMMMGYDVPELTSMAMSAISELGNMIMGNAATAFSNHGTLVDITPPTLIRGELFISSEYTVNICIPLVKENDGEVLLNINVSVRKDK